MAGTKLMMLPTDVSSFHSFLVSADNQMALVTDPKMKPWVEKYAADQQLFFKDFALAFAKLIELGVQRDDTGFAQLVNKSAKEGKPLDKTRASGGGCPFAGTTGKGRDAKL